MFIVGLSILAPKAQAEHKTSYGLYGTSLKAKTEKPDIFGRKKTEIKDSYGRVIGTAVTEKPDIFGRVKTTYKDKYGRKVGSATTEKPDIFGNRKTTHKGNNPFNFFRKKK